LVAALATKARYETELVHLEDAEDLYDQALRVCMLNDDDDEDAAAEAGLLINKADVQRRRAHLADAEVTLRWARNCIDSTTSPELQLGGWHNIYGIVCKDGGRYAEAREHYTTAMSFAHLDDLDFEASLSHNLAGLAHVQRLFAEAEAPARDAVRLRQKVGSKQSGALAADLSVLGAILVGLDRLDEAELRLVEALAIWQHRYGDSHYEVAVNLHNLADLHARQGKTRRALDEFGKALRIKQQLLGRDHPELAAIHNNIGMLHAAEGRTAEAEVSFGTAISILSETLGPNHPFMRRCIHNREQLAMTNVGQPEC